MRLYFLLCGITLLLSACPRDTLGDRLFDLNYAPINVLMPAGQPAFQVFVNAQPNFATNFRQNLADAGLTEENVDLVGGLRARLTSLNGDDFSEIERITLRVCPVDQGQCDQFDLMFTIDDLNGRRQSVVNLNPTPKNFRPLFLTDERVNFELTFQPFRITTRPIEARLDWSVAVVGGL